MTLVPHEVCLGIWDEGCEGYAPVASQDEERS